MYVSVPDAAVWLQRPPGARGIQLSRNNKTVWPVLAISKNAGRLRVVEEMMKQMARMMVKRK